MSHRREFEALRKMVEKEDGAQYREILLRLNELQASLSKVATMSDQNPDFGMTLHAIGIKTDELLRSVRNSGVRGIKIPPSLHVFRTSLRQPDLVKQIASQIAV